MLWCPGYFMWVLGTQTSIYSLVQQTELSPSSPVSTFCTRSPISLRLWVATISSSWSFWSFPPVPFYSPGLAACWLLTRHAQSLLMLMWTQTPHPEGELHFTAAFTPGFLSRPWDRF